MKTVIDFRYFRNIFKDGEVQKKSNMQKMHIANSDRSNRSHPSYSRK